MNGRNIGSRRLARTAQRANLSPDKDLSREQLVAEEMAARVIYNNHKKEATTLRGKHLDSLAAARSEAGLEAPATAIHNMRKREKQRQENRVIKSAMNPARRRALVMVQSTWADGSTATHSSKSEIETAGLKENDRHSNNHGRHPCSNRLPLI